MKIKNLILILFLVISFLVVVGIVTADSCCLNIKGKNGQYCVSEKDGASVANCETGMWFLGNCDSREECSNKGCCYVENDCREGEPKIKCLANGGDFTQDSCKNTPKCRDVCCEIGFGGLSGYSYILQTECDNKQGVVKEEINDEITCKNLNKGIDSKRVCCVLSDNTCSRILSDD